MSAARAVAGPAVSLATSWLLVSRLERVGERLRLSEALLGVVAALAADAPEVTAAVSAMTSGQRRLGAGVVIGSNVSTWRLCLAWARWLRAASDCTARWCCSAGPPRWAWRVYAWRLAGALLAGAGRAVTRCCHVPRVLGRRWLRALLSLLLSVVGSLAQ
jgi:Sodium/calcium exchanger protein